MENVRPSDLWADTRTLDLNNTKKCYQLDGNIGWFHICAWQYCFDRKLAFGTQLIYINDSPWHHGVALTGGKRSIYRLNSSVNRHRSVALKLLGPLLISTNHWCFMYEQTEPKDTKSYIIANRCLGLNGEWRVKVNITHLPNRVKVTVYAWLK